MMYAVKGNKQLRIEEAEKETYLKLGYDIAKIEEGALVTVASSPAKTVSYAKYKELEDENKDLKRKMAELEKKVKKKDGGE